MDETPKTNGAGRILRRISKRPILFFSWLTALLFLGTIGLDILLDRVQRGPNWSDFAALSVIVGGEILFGLSFLSFILSLISRTRPFMTWMLCDFWFWLFTWQTMRRALIGLAVLATLIAVFYAEENWRGKLAWENCKRELEAKGEVLDWNAYIPPPVPDDQNFFKAPGINESDWVGRGSREFSKPLSKLSDTLHDRNTNATSVTIAQLAVTSISDHPNPNATETILRVTDPGVREQAGKIIEHAVGPHATSARGFTFVAASPDQTSALRILLLGNETPTINRLADLFPRSLSDLNATVPIDSSRVRVVSSGDNSFRVVLGPPPISAADYLNLSDAFERDFDVVRAAISRPYTRMDGDYTQPAEIPIPNFVVLRIVAQTLADRAKCHLLLGHPEKALRDLTLMHDICRITEARPTGKPMTLLAAMINVAITGLYANTIADGFKLQAWHEAELKMLQEQLSEINLLPFVFSAFEQEPVGECRSFETLPASRFAAMMFFSPPNPNLWEKLKNPTYLLISWMPRGWVHQNMVNIAMRKGIFVGGFDPLNSILLPNRVEAGNREVEKLLRQRGPYTFLANIALPNYSKAIQTLARNQTLANETQIACALERYRLAHGQYPETLEALVPQVAEKLPHDLIGGQPLKYRRTDDRQFLLYSIGWNEKDDGGQVVSNKDGKPDLDQGDWVWQVPEKQP